MYKELSISELLNLNGAKLTEKEYFLDLIENKHVTDHQDGSDAITYRSKWITVANEEILIKVIKK